MRELVLSGTTGQCRILFGGRLEGLPELTRGRRVVVVTDANVLKAQGDRFADFDHVEVGLGEGAKTLDTVRALYGAFFQREIDRSCFVVGIGGGIVCDVAGFAASTYQRGLPFGFAPTSLLAQVDAAIGGKNGVNLEGFKNMVGLIRQPEFVLVDPSALATLPPRELRCGLAEVVKAAAVGDAGLFALLEERAEAALALEPGTAGPMVEAAAGVKVRLVQADEEERGPRTYLNFGHTLGHALEKTAGMPHGEAVAVGMAHAARLSARLGLLGGGEAERIRALLHRLGLPTALPAGTYEAALGAIRQDKKRRGGEVGVVLLEAIGKPVLRPVKIEDLGEALR